MLHSFKKNKRLLLKEMLLTGYNLPLRQYNPLNKKKNSILARKLQCVERCNTSFNNEAHPSSHLSCMTVFLGKIQLLQTNCREDKVFPQVRSSILAEKYKMWKDAIHLVIKLSLPRIFPYDMYRF
jgi:hypothetical protein